MHLNKSWYILLVPTTIFCYLAAIMFLISGITNSDSDVIESIKLFVAAFIQTLLVYIPYRKNNPNPKKFALHKENFEETLIKYSVPESAKNIVISKCDALGICEKCAVVWRGATHLNILLPDVDAKLYKYPLSDFTHLLKKDISFSREEIKIINAEWNKQNMFLKHVLFALRNEIKGNTAQVYEFGGLLLSSHSCYLLLDSMKFPLENISFGEGNRKDILENYYSDGAIPYPVYEREKIRLS